ncbi:MAG: hypothetical protein GKR97_19455 [Rhizobiaceae bacterium]|nr:hypothetical protein [Rhizobiaceae bacterium]
MRSAYSGTPGYFPQSASFETGNSGYEVGNDRLSNIRRSIDSIEQRLMSAAAPVAGYGPPAQFAAIPAQMTPNYAQMPPPNAPYAAPHMSHQHHFQHQMGQVPAAVPYQYQPTPVHPHNNMRAEIAQRQQMLNANAVHTGQQVNATSRVPQEVSTAANVDGVGQQLEALKRELAGIRSQVAKPIAVQQSVPQVEIDRIAKALADIQAQEEAGDSTIEQLTKELGHLRSAMKGDVRSVLQKGLQASGESQVDSLSKRLDALGKDVRSAIRSEMKGTSKDQTSDLVKRFEQLSQSIDQISLQSANVVAPRVDNLSAQLDALRMTIDDLPQTLSISRIEDRLGELASKVSDLNDVAASNSNSESANVTADEFVSLEKRLDEIARALVAVSNTGRTPPQVDMSGIERIEASMSELARNLDSVAEPGDDPNLEKLAVRIEGLTERLASFEKYAESGDLGGASAMFAAPDTGVIEDQLRALNSRIDEVAAQPGTGSLEEQIQQLSQRVEEASNIHSTSAQMSGLEAQIGQIIQQMDGIDGPANVDFSPVEARLGQIEHQLQSNQNFSLEAAQQAAQHAVSMMGPQSEAGSVIEALAHDLKSLQLLAEGNAAQSSQSVQEVHQTLQQVVERLGVIEGALENESVRPATVVAADTLAMPSTATLQDPIPFDEGQPHQGHGHVGGPDGLVDAAIADENLGVVHQAALDVGLVDPLQNDAVETNPAAANFTAPSAPENLPLEPGSSAPSIDQIVQQASAQLNQTHSNLAAEPDGLVADPKIEDERSTGDLRPDAVAAARRALQATTAEMAAVRDESDGSSEKSKSKLGKLGLLNSFSSFDSSKLRKPLVLGAAALLLAIVTFKGIGLFTGTKNQPMAKLDAPAVEMSASKKSNGATETADVAAVPEKASADKSVRTIGELAKVGAEAPKTPSIIPSKTAQTTTVTEESPALPAQKASVPVADTESAVENSVVNPISEPAVETDKPVVNAKKQGTATPKNVYDVSANAGPAALIAAASSGDPKALFQLGMRYSDGDNVTRNMTESAKWFKRSADAGFAPAQYSLGSLYEKGIGVERNIATATSWYEKAALQGNARAMHNLAVIFAMGNPPAVQPNMDAAVDWFKKAAQFGIKDSQFNLGILYGQGMGVPQNLIDSYKWFALAAKTGDSDANKKRDEVANAMDPNDLDYARKEVNNWAPSKLNEAVNRVAVPEVWRGRAASGTSSSQPAAQNISIKQAQNLLNQRGFEVGEPDGFVGPKTKRAIMEFQKDAGIPITGKVDKKLLQALEL